MESFPLLSDMALAFLLLCQQSLVVFEEGGHGAPTFAGLDLESAPGDPAVQCSDIMHTLEFEIAIVYVLKFEWHGN